jgi:curved DNA-binding protein CbpA
MKDHYKTLDVPATATADQIKKAYQKLALKFHPDKNVGNEEAAAENFKDIGEAYGVLGDPQKKTQYDRTRPKEKQKPKPRAPKASAAPKSGSSSSSGPQASAAPNSQQALYKEFTNIIRNYPYEIIRPNDIDMRQEVENKLKNLVVRGLDVNARYESMSIVEDKLKLSILHIAIIKNKEDLLKCLLDRNVNVDAMFDSLERSSGWWKITSSLELAIEYLDDTELSSRLITNQTNITADVLDEALEARKPFFVSAIFNKAKERRNLNSIIFSNGTTALHKAANNNYIEGMRLLLDTGMNINSVSELGNTALHSSIIEGKHEAAQELLNHGARVNILNNKGESPLTLAVEKKDKRSVDMVVAVAQQQGVLEDVVEFYAEDKTKKTTHYAIASYCSDKDPEQLMEEAKYQKLTALSDLMDNPSPLLEALKNLKEREIDNTQIRPDLPSRESSAAHASSSGGKGKRPSSPSIDEDFNLGAQEINMEDLRAFYNSPRGQDSLKQHNVSSSSSSSQRPPSSPGGDRKRSRT